MVTTDGFAYEYDDTISKETETDEEDEEETQETSGYRIISSQVMRALP